MGKKNTGRPSAVEKSPFRREIEEMLREGKSPDFISRYLKTNGEHISRSAIYRYKKDRFNIQAEAITKYNNLQSRKRLDKASDDLVNDLQIIDKQILEVSGKIDISKMTENQKAIYLTNLFNAKYKILGHEEANVEVNVNNSLSSLFDDDLIEEVLHESETTENSDK
ncbi:MAG: DUF3486 family protein [Methanobrevibacter woesei]|nr:DUF3486 family protein [Methanobrevibacter woesei]